MIETSRVVHTARTHTTGGREQGVSRSLDGRLDVRLAAAGSDRIGTNPEHLFAAAWSASLESTIGLIARRRNIALPPGVTIAAEVDLNLADRGYFLSARISVAMPGVERSTARALIDEAHETCPYSKAMRAHMEVAIKLVE